MAKTARPSTPIRRSGRAARRARRRVRRRPHEEKADPRTPTAEALADALGQSGSEQEAALRTNVRRDGGSRDPRGERDGFSEPACAIDKEIGRTRPRQLSAVL